MTRPRNKVDSRSEKIVNFLSKDSVKKWWLIGWLITGRFFWCST